MNLYWIKSASIVLTISFLLLSCSGLSGKNAYHREPFTQKIPYMVRIEDQNGLFRGTGFLISRSGLVLTVSHVVRYHSPIRAILNGKTYMAETVFDDPVLDMTIVRLPVSQELRWMDVPCFWISDSIRIGDTVIVLGERPQGNVALIPAYMIAWSSFRIWPGSYQDVIKIYPADPGNGPQPGFSGGPIFNIQKYVIGLFCCYEKQINKYYNGIPSSRIISRLHGTEWIDDICVVSEDQPFPLPGFIYDMSRI